jgi:hypothetical protein
MTPGKELSWSNGDPQETDGPECDHSYVPLFAGDPAVPVEYECLDCGQRYGEADE